MVAIEAIQQPSTAMRASRTSCAKRFPRGNAPTTRCRVSVTVTCQDVAQPTTTQSKGASRRSFLGKVLKISMLSLSLSSEVVAQPAWAEATGTMAMDVDPSNFDFPVIQLPKDFVDLAYDLIDALRDAIETDLSGAAEREVRRKAEPAKDLVKQFINNWSGSSAIAETTACSEIRDAVRELGEFYRTKGQRAGMTNDVAERILGHLSEAEKALPERQEKKSFLGL